MSVASELRYTPARIVAAEEATPTAYRSSLTSVDVLSAPTTSACSAVAGGSLADGTYHTKVVGVNAYGRTTPSGDRTQATSLSNNTVRMPITQLAGATHYDIYLSTDADPKWVGRITEAQRATGIKITAVGTTGAGGTANAVDVEVAGTGLVAGTTAAVNTAYSMPSAYVDGSGREYVEFDVTMTRTGDAVAPALVLTPFYYNSRTGTYYAGTPQTLTFGGAAGVYTPLKQRIRVSARGNPQIVLLVQSIAGTGASVDIDAVLN